MNGGNVGEPVVEAGVQKVSLGIEVFIVGSCAHTAGIAQLIAVAADETRIEGDGTEFKAFAATEFISICVHLAIGMD